MTHCPICSRELIDLRRLKKQVKECRGLAEVDDYHSYFDNGNGDLVIRLMGYFLVRWGGIRQTNIYGYIECAQKRIIEYEEYRTDDQIKSDLEKIMLLT